MAGYIVIPVGDVPFLGVSLSAPVFLFIFLQLFLGQGLRDVGRYRLWLSLAGVFWLGLAFSLASNTFTGVSPVDGSNWKLLIQFAYWLLVFMTTAYIISQAAIGPQLVKVLRFMLVLLAAFRWGEAVLFGKIGAWTKVLVLTQNSYGIMFSTFAPLLLVPLVTPAERRWPAISMAAFVWGAALINGSRGSWISIAFGMTVFFLLYLRVNPKKVGSLFWIVLLIGFLGAAALLAPESWTEPVRARYDTMQDLDHDKSFQIRQVMIQKGLKMFYEAPLMGAGLGNFTRVAVALEHEFMDISKPGWQRKSAHNSYIALLAETGLAGCLPFALLLFCLIFQGYRAVVQLLRQRAVWPLGLYVGFLGMSLHLWALHGLYGTGTWFMYGAVAGITEIFNHNKVSFN